MSPLCHIIARTTIESKRHLSLTLWLKWLNYAAKRGAFGVRLSLFDRPLRRSLRGMGLHGIHARASGEVAHLS
ncbi:hypothetical protein, partial [Dickeya oryzae]